MACEIAVFGESLIRVATDLGVPYAEADRMSYHIGGAELNVAVNMAQLGCQSRWISVLCEDELGDDILARVHRQGVETDCVLRKPGPVGIYFVEKAALPRGYRVLKRQSSALGFVGDGQVSKSEMNWDRFLKDCQLFYSTGIAAGLSSWCANQVIAGMQAARQKKILTAFDFNFRAKLWPQEEAKKVYKQIVPHVDILFGSEMDLKTFLDMSLEEAVKKFPELILSERTEKSEYKIRYYSKGEVVTSKAFLYQNVDRIGVGDAMAAGFIYGMIHQFPLQQRVDFAAACGAIKYSIEGDWNLVTVKDVERVISSPTGGISR